MSGILLFSIASIFIGVSQCEEMTIRACEGHKMKLFCEPGEIIKVNWANYGRTDHSFCHYFEDIESTADCLMETTTDIVKNMCDGKKNCFIEAINEIFGDPCPGQVKYIEAIYDCVPKAVIKLDPNDETVEMKEKELLEILDDLGEKDANGQDLKAENALDLLNLFANVDADAKADEVEDAPQIFK